MFWNRSGLYLHTVAETSGSLLALCGEGDVRREVERLYSGIHLWLERGVSTCDRCD
jgi:hypothetical protein